MLRYASTPQEFKEDVLVDYAFQKTWRKKKLKDFFFLKFFALSIYIKNRIFFCN